MVALGLALAQGGGGSGGGGNQNGGGNSGPGNSNQGPTATSTFASSLQSQSATVTNPWAAPTTTQSATSTSTSTSTSSGAQRGVIIGAVVGGLAFILILALVGTWCLQRRKKRELAAKNGTAQPVTYTGLNSAFTGVPFRHNDQNLSPQQTQSLLPGAVQHGLGIRGGGFIPMTSSADTNLFLPSYADSQAANSSHSSPAMSHHLHTPQYSPVDANILPVSTMAPTNLHTISPQTTGALSLRERDTMGFPIEHDFEMVRLTEPVPHIPVPIVAPVPRHPLVQQDSLERVVREGVVPSPSPAVSMLEPASINPARLRILSQGTPRESPILGNDPSHVRLLPQETGGMLVSGSGSGNLTWLGGGLGRNNTVSTVSSMGQSIIGDDALDSLGVGQGVRDTPTPAMYR